MKKILGLTVAALLVMGLVGGGTWAYFSDTETSTGNVLTAGTLNLSVNDVDPLTTSIDISGVYPGQTGSVDWLLKNDGTIAGSLDIVFSSIVDDENGVNEPEEDDGDEDGTVATPGTNGELAEKVYVLCYIDDNDDDAYDALDGDTLIWDNYIKGGGTDLGAAEELSNFAMAANYGSGDDKAFRLEWEVVESGIDNEIQSDSTGFDITFELLDENNPD